MTTKLLANENFPLASVEALRDYGLDVAYVAEDAPGGTDEEVLARARTDDRIVMTFDRDYGELVFGRGIGAPGVIYLRLTPSEPEEPAMFIRKALADDAIELHGWFTVLERHVVRQRPLS